MVKCIQRDDILNITLRHFFTSIAAGAIGVTAAFASSAPANPRAAATTATTPVATTRAATTNTVSRTAATTTSPRAAATNTVSRAATNTVSRAATSRAATNTVSRAATSMTAARAAASNTVSRAATSATAARGATVTNASRTARAGTARAATTARAAARATSAQSRAARATAVFNDISKIGGGYAACRESYATCMDQFCANANDTYRRCFCSSRYTEFSETEERLDAAKNLLTRFENNNLAAVSLSAGEANAMYTATIGEEAIKNDTSGAAQMLAEIGDLLSGKKKADTTNPLSNESLGLMNFDDFSLDMDNVWAGAGNSFFDNQKPTDYSTLSGQELYNDAHKQCMQLTGDACESSAVLNMAVSAYNIMITQDCNTYQKKIDTQRAAIEQTVNTAEKYLREARLEDYRSHNSADVNACLDKVRDALFADTACGPNYRRCLDYTGSYVKPSGDAHYSAQFFKLKELINLNNENDPQNTKFKDFLESRKMFATTALDSCRDIADTVWTEFKRAALIEIAQAQDELIEEVKNTCVSTMAECYDTQSGALAKLDNTRAQATGAMNAMAAREMCKDKVAACAALYSTGDTACNFNSNGQITNIDDCGLKALLSFVDTVDNVKIAEGCATAIENELKSICTDSAKNYPWGCRTMQIGSISDDAKASTTAAGGVNSYRDGDSASSTTGTLANRILNFATANCKDSNVEDGKTTGHNGLSTQTILSLQRAIQTVSEELDAQLQEKCIELNGYWMATDALTDTALDTRSANNNKPLTQFYSDVYGGDQTKTYLGVCVENSVRTQCLAQNSDSSNYATYNATTDECEFSAEWYEDHCKMLGNAYYENGVCYVVPGN